MQRLLQDPRWKEWSDRSLARRCGVSHTFVGKMRRTLTGNVSSERTYRSRSGRMSTMHTARIGRPWGAHAAELPPFLTGDALLSQGFSPSLAKRLRDRLLALPPAQRQQALALLQALLW